MEALEVHIGQIEERRRRRRRIVPASMNHGRPLPVALDPEARHYGAQVGGEEQHEPIRVVEQRDLAEPHLLGPQCPQCQQSLWETECGHTLSGGAPTTTFVGRNHAIGCRRSLPDEERGTVE